jgi:cytochrome c oxidase cbb3-type subunit 1
MASASSPASASPSASRVEVGELDASTKVPTLFFILSAAVWLVVATVLGIIAAVQLVQPSFLDGYAWLTHGRVVPMAQNALVYGWAFNAAFAVLIWVMTRLSRSPAPAWGPTVVGGLFWNAGVNLGIAGIMIGDTTGYALLEMPNYAAPLLFLAYAIIGSRIIVIFSRRRGEGVFASQWYALAALFWFPWLFTIARVSIGMDLLRGPAQAIAGAWYSHNVYSLFLAPVALATLYFLLPKRLGRTITAYPMAKLGFWSFAFFGSFGGLAALMGGPVPAWVPTLGKSANLMLLVPLFIIGINLLGTLFAGRSAGVSGGPSLSFLKFGAVAFVVATLLGMLLSVRPVAHLLQLTFATEALTSLKFYGVVSMVAFGAIYFIVPRLTLQPWPSSALISAHFWASVAGTLTIVVSLGLAGFVQGNALADVETYATFAEVSAVSSGFLVARIMGLFILMVGNLAFLVHVALAIYTVVVRKTESEAEVLFPNPLALEVSQ